MTSVWTKNAWRVIEDVRFVSDPMPFGWHIVELNFTDNSLMRTYVWGLDLSGTIEGAGGVGGLLWVNQHTGSSAGAHFCAYDGNGNVVALVSANTGTETARYEYGPFGEPIRITGPMSKENPFRFSTKRTCNTTDLVLYEYRAYSPNLGRWVNRDPLGERGGVNLYAFVGNSPIVYFDEDGRLSESACQTAVNIGLRDNAKAKAIVAEMKKRECREPLPACLCCREDDVLGDFDPTTKLIRICGNNMKNGREVIETLVHELVHAFDDCTGADWHDCGDRACSEIRAVDCSGVCAPGGGARSPHETYRQCVEKAATASTTVDPKCNAQHVKDKLNECMGDCPGKL